MGEVVALLGVSTRDKANVILMKQDGMIASFSRALSEGLDNKMSDEKVSVESVQLCYSVSVNIY